ncbi:MAG: UDP-3-O-(3-hydroxymyristoyl)glucosamine N-acyltransferase, partial [Pseudomonadota bacterium]
MDHPGFFTRTGPHTLADIAQATTTTLADEKSANAQITDVRSLDLAGAADLSFFDNRKYLDQIKSTAAAACFVREADCEHLPKGCVPLVSTTPYHCYARALGLFYPEAARTLTHGPGDRPADAPMVNPDAIIETGAIVEPGAVIAAEARIGTGTRICSGAFIGYRCTIGRDGYVGANATVTHTIVGDRVVIHQGAQIGQDGFGFAMGPQGHLRVPQIGRVIIQDDVDIGASTCIDRGAFGDTVLGERTK